MSSIRYEWDIETVTTDEHEDIVDHNHRDRYRECVEDMQRHPAPEGHTDRIVLVCDILDADGDIAERGWAYMEDGKLPESFCDSRGAAIRKVPKRFHAEVAKEAKR